jgi:putative aldouronate transport system permease protein
MDHIQAVPKTAAVPKKRIVKHDQVAFNIIGAVMLFIFGMLCIIPFWLVITASFTDEGALMRNGYSLAITQFSTSSYALCFKSPQDIIRAYATTICVTVVGTAVAVLLATMTGYVLQRKDFPWGNQLSFFFFFTTLFNGGLVPTYIIYTKYYHLKNTYWGLIIPLLFSVWNMIIAKNYMKSVPYEITESAKVDGANDIYIFFRLILPLCTPLLATLGLFAALAYWNDWYFCMLYITDSTKFNLQYFLNQMLSTVEGLKSVASNGGTIDISTMDLPQETMKMAMTVIATGPIIFLYPFVQKYFVKGLTIGSVKG